MSIHTISIYVHLRVRPGHSIAFSCKPQVIASFVDVEKMSHSLKIYVNEFLTFHNGDDMYRHSGHIMTSFLTVTF